jgi:hypothetical protein
MTSALANPTSNSVPDGSDGVSQTSGVGTDSGEGLRDRDDRPRSAPAGIAAALGGMWGLFGYSVLWDGVPFSVDRPFVQSVTGTLVLLPIRTTLWGIHLAETEAGRTFDFSRNHWWIGLLAGATGAAFALGALWVVRRLIRRVRNIA